MSNERFIKFIPGEKSEWLIKRSHNAFVLLCIIASRARRVSGHIDGLELGEALIGDWESYGMSEQNYRTAKDILCKLNFIKIIETNRTRKKSTTGVTTEGTKVKLLNSDIYDINCETTNDRANDCLTTDQRLANDEQEGIRKNKNKKKINKKENPENVPEIPKLRFLDHILLTQEQHDKLLALHKQEKLLSMLDILDAYLGNATREYISHYDIMKRGGWVEEKANEKLEKSINPKTGQSNYEYASSVAKSYISRVYELQLDTSGITFIPKMGQQTPWTLKFNDSGFREQLDSNLRKKEFIKNG